VTLVRRPLLALAPFAVLVIVLALATNVLPLREILSQRQSVAASQARLTELEETNAALERQVEALDAPIEVERLARSELGYIRPGEEAFAVISPEGAEAGEPPTRSGDRSQLAMAGSVVEADGGRGALARLWDFVTGRDLSG
jgi:cell division protein FtsB